MLDRTKPVDPAFAGVTFAYRFRDGQAEALSDSVVYAVMRWMRIMR
jgi:hypothetical protein